MTNRTDKTDKMGSLRIGIVCYPTIGGSGIVASELGNELARRGHSVHFFSYDPPFRLDQTLPKVHFHRVEVNEYRLFKYPDYTLPLAVKIGAVHQHDGLDILHVHYAVPHATAALLARVILDRNVRREFKIVTSLHGTDITLLGKDPNLQAIICYSIDRSDGVTAVSESLKRETYQVFPVRRPITVIHNFFTPKPPTRTREAVRRSLGISATEVLAIHISNVRPVKRIPDVLSAVARISRLPLKLLVVAGDSFTPYQPLVVKLRLRNRVIVRENVFAIENYLNAADVGLFASEQESFGMGILETMSFGHPVVATNVGGIPEVMVDGQTGYLARVGKVAALAQHLNRLARDRVLREKLGRQASARAASRFSAAQAVNRYVSYYQRILAAPHRATGKRRRASGE